MSDQAAASQPTDVRLCDVWFSPKRFSIFLALLVVIAFHDVLLGGRSFVIRDFGLFSYPVASFVKGSYAQGEIPFWNPLNTCGIPFLAQFNTLALYPGSLVYLALPLTWALPFFCLLHLYLGGLGTYFLARRWTGSALGGAVAGLVFAFNGLSLNLLMWPSHIAAFSLMPWTVLAVETGWQKGGRHLIVGGVVSALLVLAGGPEQIVFSWLILFGLLLAHMKFSGLKFLTLTRRFLTIAALTAAFSAPLWLPFIDLAAHSNRDNHFGGSAWSMPVSGFANFLVPMFHTTQWETIVYQESQKWTSSYYPGIATVFLVIVALLRRREWRVRLLGVFLVISLVIALGDNGYVFAWMRHAFPFLGKFRYPVKFLLLSLFIIPLLAAYGISYYEKQCRPWKFDAICAGILLVLVGVVTWVGRKYVSDEIPWATVLHNGLWRMAFLLFFVAAIFLFWRVPKRQIWMAASMLLLIWADLLTHEPWQNPTVDSSYYQPGLAQLKIKLDPEPVPEESRLMMSPFSAQKLYYRPNSDPASTLLLHRIVFLANLNLVDGLPKVDGFFSLNLKETDRVLRQFDDASPQKIEHLENLLGVSQTIEEGKVFDWVRRDSYLPVITVGEEPVFGHEEANFAAVTDPAADIRHTVYLPLEAKSEVKAHREDGARIISKKVLSNRVAVQVDTPRPAMALINQSYYHNWNAYIDGKPAKLWRADYAFQAVEMPAGKHELKLLYVDTAFRIGVGLFALTVIACVGLWLRSSETDENASA
ncbi:MAG: YfhO family protein [Limisphaerales bacterium]